MLVLKIRRKWDSTDFAVCLNIYCRLHILNKSDKKKWSNQFCLSESLPYHWGETFLKQIWLLVACSGIPRWTAWWVWKCHLQKVCPWAYTCMHRDVNWQWWCWPGIWDTISCTALMELVTGTELVGRMTKYPLLTRGHLLYESGVTCFTARPLHTSRQWLLIGTLGPLTKAMLE